MENYVVTTDRRSIDMNKLFDFLHKKAYWSRGIPYHVFETSINNSVPFTDGGILIAPTRS